MGAAISKEQTRRKDKLTTSGVHSLTVTVCGLSNKEGFALFAGAEPEHWERVRPVMESLAFKASNGSPCAGICGKPGASSFIKMFHDACECAVLQIWAEAYTTMHGFGLDRNAIPSVLVEWKTQESGALDTYCLNLILEVARKREPEAENGNGSFLLDKISDMLVGRDALA